MRGAGDLNGDGYADVVIGAPLYKDASGGAVGRVYVYYGSPNGLGKVSDWNAQGAVGGSLFGWSVDQAGDVNGDGYGDLIVGAYNSGSVYVYTGSPTGLGSTPHWILDSNQSSEQFGRHVAGVGDVNGDGLNDIAVSAPNYTNGESWEGCVLLFYGSTDSAPPTAAWSAESNQADAQMGVDIGAAGDLNADGYADLIIGVPFYDTTVVSGGRVEAFYGSPKGFAREPDAVVEGAEAGAQYGRAISTAGDFNHDGYADIIVGSYRANQTTNAGGRVYAY